MLKASTRWVKERFYTFWIGYVSANSDGSCYGLVGDLGGDGVGEVEVGSVVDEEFGVE